MESKSQDPQTTNAPNPPTPKPGPGSRADSNPYPTTFVQADSSSFKQVVQLLTGTPPKQPPPPPHTAATSDHPPPSPHSRNFVIPPVKTGPKKQAFKLYERRNHLKNGLMINPMVPGFSQSSRSSPRSSEILSPSVLDFPSLVLSPVTPLIVDQFDKSSSPSIRSGGSEEEKAVAEKKFYLLPSPVSKSAPTLLPLFPVSSTATAGVSGSSS